MSLQTFFNQTATLKTRTGYDEYGKEKQSSGSPIGCRFQETNKTRILPDGSIEPIDAYAIIDATTIINTGDHLIYNGIDYRVLSVNLVVDGHGLAHHSEVNLSKWQS